MAVRLSVRHAETPATSTGARDEEPSFEFEQTRITIGRGKGADVRLPDLSVSELHATIQVSGSRYTLIDEGSSNGTRVNGVALVPARPRTLDTGDAIEIGPFRLQITLGPILRGATTPERTASLARRLLRELSVDVTLREPPCLRVIAGPDAGTLVNLPSVPGKLVIGRDEDAGLQLRDPDVSRAHLEVERDLDGAVARDLESKNGLVVNGKRLRERRLRHGDVITLGKTEIAYEDVAEAALKDQEGRPDEPVTRTMPGAKLTEDVAPVSAVETAKPVVASVAPVAAAGPGSADLIVYGLAAAVLLASLLGLAWLFGS